MALQSSGAITLADIAGEFGGSTPHGIDEYYGVDTTPSGAIPSSGVIAFDDFYGVSSFIGGIMTEQGGWPKGVSASGAAGSQTSNTNITLPAGTRSVFFVGVSLDNGFQTVIFNTIKVGGATCTRRVNVSDSGEYTSNVYIGDYTFPSALTSDTVYTMQVNMANTASASGGASCWCFISEFAVNAAHAASGTHGGFNTSMQIYDKGLVIGGGQSGISGGYTGAGFDTYVNNPYPGVDGSWGSYSRGYGWFVPPVTTTTNIQVWADATDYAQATGAVSYQLI